MQIAIQTQLSDAIMFVCCLEKNDYTIQINLCGIINNIMDKCMSVFSQYRKVEQLLDLDTVYGVKRLASVDF